MKLSNQCTFHTHLYDFCKEHCSRRESNSRPTLNVVIIYLFLNVMTGIMDLYYVAT